ncbi:RHS repeat-associated core domain-containing protein [Kocuria rosea]|uniref:RHS repeat-associated core domain-containing protein n=1 Tax=Kocuria rosea TaxID=1275 RepID=UPI003D6CB6D7
MISPVTGSIISSVLSVVKSVTAVSFRIRPDPHTPFFLQSLGHRWYSVEWGRFSQQDTLDAPLDPANANRYAFAANDPINLADPTGQITEECAIALAGLGVSFVGIVAAGASTPVTGPIGVGVAAGILASVAGGAISGAGVVMECE